MTHLRPTVSSRIVGVHPEENSQGTGETLGFLFEEVRPRLALEARAPQERALFLETERD